MGVHVFPILNPPPSPSPYHLSGSSHCTSPKHPVSCIEPRLVIRFLHDSIHVSVLFSQVIPPSPSPTESKRLFYTSVSLLLSCIQGYHYDLPKFHIYALAYYKHLNAEFQRIARRDKKAVVRIHNGVLLSYQKEYI